MVKRPVTPKEMNELYELWSVSGDTLNYNKLIQAVMDNAFNRFSRTDGDARAEDISAIVVEKIYRALPGYSGLNPLKPYDPARGSFNAFQSTMARTTRLDYLKRRTAHGVGKDELVYSGTDNLDWLFQQAQDPWATKGRRRIQKKPTEGSYASRKDPKVKVPFGKSAWGARVK